MSKEVSQKGYRQIFKATSLFGGVQVFNIIIGIIRSKIIAVLLGPAGMGISGLLTSTTGMITSLTNFGLGSSAVKNVAESYAQNDTKKISRVVSALHSLVWITGTLGLLITLIFAPYLSELTFETKEYTNAFRLLSITLLLAQLTIGRNVIMQGTRSLKLLAKANLLGSLFGLLLTIPFYYFWGIKGIVPALIITSIVTLFFSWFFSRKISISKMKLTYKQVWIEGKDMLTMGIMLSLSGIITLAVSYVTRIYIGRIGGVEEVGLYNAGFAIIGTYVGLVFTAMATDYYPRLAGVASNNEIAKETINQQADIAILILAPILMVFFVFIHWIVQLLYSTQFMSVNGMIHWAALGMFFRAVGWAIAFLFLAKGTSKLFFLNELIANIYFLVLNVLGYKYYGLDGLGISFLIGYILYAMQVFIISNKKYKFNFNRAFIKIFILQLLCGVVCFCIVRLVPSFYKYIIGCILIILSSIYSYKELDKRMDLKSVIARYLKNNRNER